MIFFPFMNYTTCSFAMIPVNFCICNSPSIVINRVSIGFALCKKNKAQIIAIVTHDPSGYFNSCQCCSGNYVLVTGQGLVTEILYSSAVMIQLFFMSFVQMRWNSNIGEEQDHGKGVAVMKLRNAKRWTFTFKFVGMTWLYVGSRTGSANNEYPFWVPNSVAIIYLFFTFRI